MSPTTLRRPTEERRREICAAALDILGHQGRHALSTKTVAEAVGVSTGALFRHFASLDEMLDEMVASVIGTLDATFPDPSLPPLDRLLALARARVRVLRSNPGIAWLLRSDEAFLTLPERAVAALRDLSRRSQLFLLDAIRAGAADGSIRKDIDSEALLITVMGTIHGLVGMPGVHRLSRDNRSDSEPVLSGLGKLLSPAPHGAGRGEPVQPASQKEEDS